MSNYKQKTIVLLIVVVLSPFVFAQSATTSGSDSSSFQPPSTVNYTKCQQWKVNNTNITSTPVPVPFPAPSQCVSGQTNGDYIEWGWPQVCFGSGIFQICIPLPPYVPVIGQPFFSDTMEVACPPGYQYLNSFTKGWAGNWNSSGGAWVSNVQCCTTPAPTPMLSATHWQNSACP